MVLNKICHFNVRFVGYCEKICYTYKRGNIMASESNKKLSIIYTLEILKEYSDENHLLTQADIAKLISQVYGMECERKSIATNIESLIDLGIDIIKVAHKGCYIGERVLEPSEISFIIDALFTSKSINGKQAKDLSQKLSNLLSRHQRKKYNFIYKADKVTRTGNYDLFYNIEMIQEAISNNKKISFVYNRPGIENKKKPYVVNPYFLISSQGRYYLVCNFDYYNEISNYKVDFINDIKILDEERKPITEVENYENGIDIAKYANEHIYAFSDKTVTATLKLADEGSASYIIEWFGKDSKIYKKGDITFAEVVSNEQALIYWCIQYGENVELIQPNDTRNKIKNLISMINDKYNGGK